MRTIGMAVAFGFVLLVNSCSFLNVFHGPDHFDRHYLVDVIRDSVDNYVSWEANGKDPVSYPDRTAKSWRAFWEMWFETWRSSEGEAGKRAEELVSYVATKRREAGLPDLATMPYLSHEPYDWRNARPSPQ